MLKNIYRTWTRWKIRRAIRVKITKELIQVNRWQISEGHDVGNFWSRDLVTVVKLYLGNIMVEETHSLPYWIKPSGLKRLQKLINYPVWLDEWNVEPSYPVLEKLVDIEMCKKQDLTKYLVSDDEFARKLAKRKLNG